MPQLSRVMVVGATAIVLAGCNIPTDLTTPGKEVTESKSVEKDKAEMVKVSLEIAAGELRVSGGAAKLMEGDFTYNVEKWKPEIRYEGSNFRGNLTIKQSGGSSTMGNVKNEWNVRLSDDVPMDISVKMGAGESKLKLGDMKLRSIEVHLGAGRCEMDLRGKPDKSYDATIRGGVGEATIYVPKEVGVIAEAKGGLGEIKVRGLTKDGSSYHNEAYGKAKTTIRLDVTGGIGAINIFGDE